MDIPNGCSYCGERQQNLQRCGRCKSEFYCSKVCQKQHWKDGHKNKCKGKKTIKLVKFKAGFCASCKSMAVPNPNVLRPESYRSAAKFCAYLITPCFYEQCLQEVRGKIDAVFVVNSQNTFINVANVRGRFTAQEIVRNNTGKLVIDRIAKSRTMSLVNHKCT